MNLPIVIVGGGLAGLAVANLLHRAGTAFLLLEARDRFGGRILSVGADGKPSSDGFDLGPSWFWPGMQGALDRFVSELGLPVFQQASEGDIVVQRSPHGRPERYSGMRMEPPSMRVAGGTAAMISALMDWLPRENVRHGMRATGVQIAKQAVEIFFADSRGVEHRTAASHVIFALPPRLLEATVSFSPKLDVVTQTRWRQTPTWMAPHAKFFALYDRPFWRDCGLSGNAQSAVGPLVEIHDATTASGKAALFGFVGVPAEVRASAGRDNIVSASIRQLTALFGPKAGTPRATLFKDWAADPLTATPLDQIAGDHPAPVAEPWIAAPWEDFVSLAGSETSQTEPGYLAGAIEAAARTAAGLVSRRAAKHEVA